MNCEVCGETMVYNSERDLWICPNCSSYMLIDTMISVDATNPEGWYIDTGRDEINNTLELDKTRFEQFIDYLKTVECDETTGYLPKIIVELYKKFEESQL